MGKFIYLLIFIFVLVLPCPASANGFETGPCGAGNSKSNPCQISFYALISNPSDYDGRFIRLIGFYPASGARVIYLNRDAALQGDFLSSLLLDAPLDKECGYHNLSGLFMHDTRDSGLASGVYQQAGRLKNVNVFFPLRSLDRGCGILEGSVDYLNGVFPVRSVDW